MSEPAEGHVEVDIELEPLTYAFSLDVVREAYEEYYESKGIELMDGEPDFDQCMDWLQNNMNWSDIVEGDPAMGPEIVKGPMVSRRQDFPDVEEQWLNAEKRIYEVTDDGDVIQR